MRLMDEIYKSLDVWGENPVFVERYRDESETIINAETFKNRIDKHILFFRNLGIIDNVLVPVFIDNCWDFPAIFLALLQTGAKPVLLKKAYRQLELEQIFNDAKPSVIICDDDFIQQLEFYKMEYLLILRENGELIARGEVKPRHESLPPGTVSINYTYRGYGYPLGAIAGEESLLNAAQRFQDYVCFAPGDRILALLPMSHIFTMISSIILPLLYQITTYILYSVHPKEILKTMKSCKINNLSTVPEILLLLAKLKNDNEKYPFLQTLISGGSYLSKDNHQYIAKRFKTEVLNGYGLTEIAPVTGNIRNQEKFGSIGKICKGLSCRISKSADSQNGEFLIKIDKSFLGYLNKPAETAEALVGGWFKTGDKARLEDGYVMFEGEMKQTRKVNGQMVDFKEVETALLRTNMVTKATVRGETNHISADVTLSENKAEDDREILRELRISLKDIIASYKIPRKINIMRGEKWQQES